MDDKSASSLQRWKKCRRLSLSEIRDMSDAPKEFAYRENLTTVIADRKRDFLHGLEQGLRDRRNDVASLRNLEFVVEEYGANVAVASQSRNRYSGSTSVATTDVVAVLQSFDSILRDSLTVEQENVRQDVGARACMVVSGFLDDLAAVSPPDELDLPTSTDLQEEEIRGSFQGIMDCLNDGSKSSMARALSVYETFVDVRNRAVAACSAKGLRLLSELMEVLAATLTRKHVCAAKGMSSTLCTQTPVYDCWVLASAPARIDLSGGWTDTPPICYEYGSMVTGMAVSIDGRRPLACRCRIVSGATGILLRAESRDSQSGALLSSVERELSTVSDLLSGYRNPSSECALLKCVLIHLGLVSEAKEDHDEFGTDLQTLLHRFCQKNRTDDSSVRLEVVATSLLPHGSGLGTSSILAGTILAAVGRCIGAGAGTSSSESQAQYNADLMDSVLNVEQLLTTGGGFQDQVNGLIGGFKTVRSEANEFPMRLSIEQLQFDSDFRQRLDNSLVLVYTGQTRLAKNLLQNVLRRWSKRTPEIVANVSNLVDGAKDCQAAIQAGDLDALGNCLSKYWLYKKTMAAGSDGNEDDLPVEPPVVRYAMDTLQRLGLVRGASLCGAGGGGFMVLLTSDSAGTTSRPGHRTRRGVRERMAKQLHCYDYYCC